MCMYLLKHLPRISSLDDCLMWYYGTRKVNDMCKVEIKISIYYVTFVHSLIFNIVSTKL